ncbi:aminoglycoside phosphotransferase family protein [Aspergillus fijiensis CBS 313.89]|uniref:Phosphotransferase family protein n=1 Tax=Aspergillus fijiensis CBS 313.89 TaxID=1448319 RepID=A0A8G1RJC3_9EURO|nr:phosphotransferase family protein [Aspergillus fijiensis CBS 313.89]RAK73768.1 phosphotransferase family protein [Aspergillus fijiensis CBS 313.89]
MATSFVPSILRPDYTWPCRAPFTVSPTTPPVPRVSWKPIRLAWGLVHRALRYFSRWYCSWFGIRFDYNIIPLPFGLVIKWTDRSSVEEAVATQMARAGGLPVPKVLNYGEHPFPDCCRRVSILMTRLPGITLGGYIDLEYNPETEEPWLQELKTCVHAMRMWTPPASRQNWVSSPLGTCLRSSRVPCHIMGPFENQTQLHNFLLSPASSHAFKSQAEFEKAMAVARKLDQRRYRMVFTQGDFMAHNILVGDDGHLSGMLDWESAGWYPEYWEYTTAMRFGRDSWWFRAVSWIGGSEYLEELDYDRALNSLTVDTYAYF